MTDRWWDKFVEEDAAREVVVARPPERRTCPACGWVGVPIDHPKIDPLLCGQCLRGLPGTERGIEIPKCPVCGSRRLTSDGLACLECDWPDVLQSEPTEEMDP